MEVPNSYGIQDPFFNDLNRTFIPCQTVLGVEAIISNYLITQQYESIKMIAKNNPTPTILINQLGLFSDPAVARVITFFIENTVRKLKPLSAYERNHHDANCQGNVSSTIKTRGCLFFAMHNLKYKFLFIKDFFIQLAQNQYSLTNLLGSMPTTNKTVLDTFWEFFIGNYQAIINDLLPTLRMSESASRQRINSDEFTTDKILQLLLHRSDSEIQNPINFIMRSIKLSLFVCNVMFTQMDVETPFTSRTNFDIDLEETMTSADFLPKYLAAIDKNFTQGNLDQVDSLNC